MCVYCTDENDRFKYARECIESLLDTTDSGQRIVFIDNGSNSETKEFLRSLSATPNVTVITLSENIGTARGINMALKLREEGENFIKCDDDVTWEKSDWVEELEECVSRDSGIGIIGLKRKDLAESPNSEHPFYRSTLEMLPHEAGQRWFFVERVKHVMGTCQMLSSELLEKVSGYFQNGLYGLDDSDMSYRSDLAGFKNVFLLNTHINHIDNGGGAYTEWKHAEAGRGMEKYHELCESYRTGKRSLYVEI